jgi:hypothetical protein
MGACQQACHRPKPTKARRKLPVGESRASFPCFGLAWASFSQDGRVAETTKENEDKGMDED